LKLYVSETDWHYGFHGRYLAACSLYAAITGSSPVGLPANLTIAKFSNNQPLEICVDPKDARYLQQVAWASWRNSQK
jgi:hypothetical protein